MVERSAERKIHIRLTLEMHRRLRMRFAGLDASIQDYVVRMLDQALDVEAEDNPERRFESMARKR